MDCGSSAVSNQGLTRIKFQDPVENLSHPESKHSSVSESQLLQRILDRITHTLQRDATVKEIARRLQLQLQADRVVLYYFFRQWKGQVVCEALSDPALTILGSTGADDCFNDDYAALYQGGRVRAISDILIEPIHECHRDFLQSIQVRANLAVPILVPKGLWGLLVAHHCHTTHDWLPTEIEQMRAGAKALAHTPSIQDA
jgi:GAF domain-containing protein